MLLTEYIFYLYTFSLKTIKAGEQPSISVNLPDTMVIHSLDNTRIKSEHKDVTKTEIGFVKPDEENPQLTTVQDEPSGNIDDLLEEARSADKTPLPLSKVDSYDESSSNKNIPEKASEKASEKSMQEDDLAKQVSKERLEVEITEDLSENLTNGYSLGDDMVGEAKITKRELTEENSIDKNELNTNKDLKPSSDDIITENKEPEIQETAEGLKEDSKEEVKDEPMEKNNSKDSTTETSTKTDSTQDNTADENKKRYQKINAIISLLLRR